MNNNKFLNEEKYQKTKKKIMFVALIILIIGISIGGSLIFSGVKKRSDVNAKYSEERKNSLKEQLDTEKQNLENRKAELKNKGVTFYASTEYDDGEAYELKIITEVLDPSEESNCLDSEYKNNTSTAKYCSLKNQFDDISTGFDKDADLSSSIPLFMLGGFIIISTLMISISIFIFGNGRDIFAFTTQQYVPVAKEGINEMAPTIGNAAGEIAKGIKNGLNDNNNNNNN